MQQVTNKGDLTYHDFTCCEFDLFIGTLKQLDFNFTARILSPLSGNSLKTTIQGFWLKISIRLIAS